MGKLVINYDKLTRDNIKELVNICPFNAIEDKGDKIDINAGCKLCKMCVRKGPKDIIKFVEGEKKEIDKSLWKGVAIYVDHVEGQIHPVTFELIGKAKELAAKINQPVYALFIGHNIEKKAEEILHYGVDNVFVYDYEELKDFTIEPYTSVFEDFINNVKPTAILVGATTIGRSLAPRVAARFRTGLTADCTILDMKENTDLIQIRPAFGGNIMAQIINPNARPQMSTVRYKVMDAAIRQDGISGQISVCKIDKKKLKSNIKVLKVTKKEIESTISDAEVIIAAGRGIKAQKDMDMVYELAELLDAKVAGTRPLVEAGWIDAKEQIGLSGRTVKPKLIIVLGVSGAVQFTAGMNSSDYIFAINKDEKAPIFNACHYGIVGDIYDIVPKIIEKLKLNKKIEVVL